MTTATVPAGMGPAWIAFDPLGRFAYAVNIGGDSVSVYSIGASGALTLSSTAATGSSPFALATTYAAP